MSASRAVSSLDTQTLLLFSRRLLNNPRFKCNYKSDVREAAVLMPLCNVDGKPSVLFTVRNLNMRSHRGEIRLAIIHIITISIKTSVSNRLIIAFQVASKVL